MTDQPGPGEMRAARAIDAWYSHITGETWGNYEKIRTIAAIIARETACSQLYAALKKLEWCIQWQELNGACCRGCPCCYGSIRNGHRHDCSLAAALAAHEKENK